MTTRPNAYDPAIASPTDRGHQVIAETFYTAIRSRFDNTPTSTSSLITRR